MARTLLVTDDAPIIREIIKDTAQNAGWEIVGEAANGQEAIDRYAELNPDACTIDLVMPEYDGLHGLRGIMKLDPEGAPAPRDAHTAAAGILVYSCSTSYIAV